MRFDGRHLTSTEPIVEKSPWKCSCGDEHLNCPQGHAALVHFAGLGLPETVDVHVAYKLWKVPRAYVAFHGIKGREVPALANHYGWERIGEQDGAVVN